MIKMRAVINFNDYQDKVFRKAGDEFECDEERAKVLMGENKDHITYAVFSEIIEKEPAKETDKLVQEEKAEEEKPKRKKKKIDTVE